MKKIDVKKLFGTSVRDRRNQLGFSQEKLAELADLHRTYVSDIERGARNVSLLNIEKLATALEISVAKLLRPDSPNEPAGVAINNNPKGNLVDVLLVEDNHDDLEMTLHAFTKARFMNRVQVVRDGEEALEYVFCRGKYAGRNPAHHPQLILLDLNLPKISGLDVLRQIKADKKTRSIPVIVLTVSQKNSDIVECHQLGAETYILKPVSFQRLIQVTPYLNLDWALLKPAEAKKAA